MDEVSIRQRLEDCFQAVFPELNQTDIATATPETVPDWDSVAQVTLISLVEEEFAVQLTEDEYGEMLSFEAWYAYLKRPRE